MKVLDSTKVNQSSSVMCNACSKDKIKEEFSKNQLAKRAYLRRCMHCIDRNYPIKPN